MGEVKRIFVYSDNPSSSLSIGDIVDRFAGCGLSVKDRGNFFEFLNVREEELVDLGMKISGTIVPDISTPLDEVHEPSYEEIELELKRVYEKRIYTGTLYDGLWLQRVFYRAMARKTPDELGSGFVHIIFTGRLFGTFESKRYHARVVLTGLPSLISTSGVVEAPARPKEYYWLKAGLVQSGRDTQELDLMYKGRFVEYDDLRLTKILSSYALQPIFCEIAGNPFCDNPSCCLYNSHWQEEVLNTQLGGELCEWHKSIITSLQKGS